jgi:hypothetical protein
MRRCFFFLLETTHAVLDDLEMEHVMRVRNWLGRMEEGRGCAHVTATGRAVLVLVAHYTFCMAREQGRRM